MAELEQNTDMLPSFGRRVAQSGSCLAAALIIYSCAGRQAPAQIPDVPVLAAERRPSSEAPSIHILALETTYVFDEAGNYVRKRHLRYRILDDRGVSAWGNVGAQWSPWYQQRPEIAASVTDLDGKVHLLDPATVAEGTPESDSPLVYRDVRELGAPLPAVRIGSVVDLTIVARTTKPMFAAGFSSEMLMGSPIPMDAVALVLDAPESLPLRYELLDARPVVRDERRAGRRRVEIKAGPVPSLEPLEPLQPTGVMSWPSVAFSTGDSWAAVAREYHRLAADSLQDSALMAIGKSLALPGGDLHAQVDRILAWQRARVRYADVEFGAASIVPAKPTATLQRGYGDCKDQAALLVALLANVGVKARIALIRSGEEGDIRPGLPGLGAFDHAIVQVAADPPIWVDPTSTYARAGQLDITTQNRHVLVIDPATDSLVRTPAFEPSANVYREVRHVKLADEGSGEVTETTSGDRVVDLVLRQTYGSKPASALQKELDQYVRNAYRSERPAKVEVTSAEDVSHPFELRIVAERSTVADTGDLEAVAFIDDRAALALIPNPLRYASDRRTPMGLTLPCHGEVRVKITPPKGYLLRDLQSPSTTKLGPGTLQREFRLLPSGEVELVTRFDMTRLAFTAEEVNEFRKEIAVFDDPQWLAVRFDHAGARLLNEGNVREAYALFQRSLTGSDDVSRNWRRYALALLDGPHVEAARAAAQKAVELDPKNASSHRVLGFTLLHDVVGRTFMEGYDRGRALAELRKAVELDPSDHTARVNLALTLEYGAAGARYANAADLDDAIAVYDKATIDELRNVGGADYSDNLFLALLHRGRFSEVKSRLRKSGTVERARWYLLLAATAAEEGPARALEEVTRSGLAGDARARALEEAAATLSSIRRYPEAAELLAAAAKVATDASSYESKRQTTAKVLRYDDAAPDQGPADTAKRVLWLLSSGLPLDDEALKKLLSQRSLSRGGLARARTYHKALRASLANAATHSGYAANLMWADLTLSALDFTVESHAPLADLVHARVRGSTGTTDASEFVVVNEGGVRRILEVANASLAICEGALDAERKGDQAAVRGWLDWAVERASAAAAQPGKPAQPLLAVWHKGQSGDSRAAVGCWCAYQDGVGAEVLPWLLEARGKTRDSARLAAIHQALAKAYLDASQPAKALEYTTRLVADRPEDLASRSLHCAALTSLGRYNECRTAVMAHLAAHPTNGDGTLLLARSESAAGKFDAARAALRRFLGAPTVSVVANEDLAWLGLFRTEPQAADLEYAVQAAEATQRDALFPLQLLALALANAGKTQEAVQTLRKLSARADYPGPGPLEWLLLGKIAEKHGLADQAAAMYKRVEPSTPPRADSHERLAQTWLSAIARPSTGQGH